MTKRPRAKTSDTDDDGLTREEYFAERELLIDARQRGFQRAEQMIMGGATGALLLSITFLEKLAPAAVVRRSEVLVIAWIALLACLCSSLLGQYSSAWAFNHEIACLNAAVNKEEIPSSRWKLFNQVCAAASAVLLVVGIALLATFAYLDAPFRR